MTESTEVQLQISKKLSEMSIELKNSDPMYEILQNLSVGLFSISDSLNKKISEVQKGRKSRGGSW